MTEQAKDILQRAERAFAQADNSAALENEKAVFLGRNGEITQMLRGMAQLTPEEKRTQGAAINQLKRQIETLLEERREAIAQAKMAQRLEAEAIDVTLPGRGRARLGGVHPVVLAWQRIEAIFRSMGFDIADGPEIEDDWTNFTALNNPDRKSVV